MTNPLIPLGHKEFTIVWPVEKSMWDLWTDAFKAAFVREKVASTCENHPEVAGYVEDTLYYWCRPVGELDEAFVPLFDGWTKPEDWMLLRATVMAYMKEKTDGS